ncbi:MAG: site-specific DNA-methyltransferase [Smithella sp.]
MPTTQQLRDRLLKKLKELFQLDQPDLDFGFYRIMHAKSDQIQEFLDKDLLKIVEDAFGKASEPRKAELQAAYEKAIQTAKEFGAANPEETEPVKKAKAALDALKDTTNNESEVYDHLYRFFERYYEDGDFISRRYYTRETSGKAAPYAIPYNGEEVKLHWANADQYYIKTAEYFSNFTFDLTKAAEIQAMKPEERLLNSIPEKPILVHLRIVEATEGAHGNVRASEATKRYFIIHKNNPVEVNAEGELIINFEYRPDPEKTGQENAWRNKRNTEAIEASLSVLTEMVKQDGRLDIYQRLLKFPAPTDSDSNRPFLAKYINQYTARNTMDYFIHKDLGNFLHRELDFYIKNEVMRLDDIENAEAPAVDSYLSKLKVLRKIAVKLIDFLAQLEEFQKKLWLKKKFVVETNYCITLDRVPEELYPEIVANKAQHDEWVKLFAIDEIAPDTTGNPGYVNPLTVDFLKTNNKIVLDTCCFDDNFKAKLLASIENFDEQCDGLLIHSENFQALNLLQERYRAQVKCVYIDPPYNATATEIIYKNGYKSSSWCSLIQDRLYFSKPLLTETGMICVTIDDYEVYNLKKIIDYVFSSENYLATIPIRNNPSGRSTVSGFAICHEYALFYANDNDQVVVGRLPHSEEQRNRYGITDDEGNPFEWENFRKSSAGSYRNDRPKQYFPLYYKTEKNQLRVPLCIWCEQTKSWELQELPNPDEIAILPIDSQGRERVWNYGIERTKADIREMKIEIIDNKIEVYKKKYFQKQGILPRTWWDKPEYSARDNGTRELSNLFSGQKNFDFPKALNAVKDALLVGAFDDSETALDFFAGSGTTGHATIKINREDGGNRKYVLVEMGDYFDTVLKPRIAKVVYSAAWKDGKPIARETGISQCFKYLRLESYEDTLNNLRFDESPVRDKALATKAALKEDYMLHYLLDVETRDSQSLLNIDAFADPTAYTLKIKKPGTDEYVVRNIDLFETFNYLIGLRVVHTAVPQNFTAEFKRLNDPEVPKDQKTKLVVDGNIKQDGSGIWWFRKLEGWLPKDPANPDNGQHEKVLIVWRKLTGDLEKDNVMLDEWFQKNRISTRDFEFDIIYVNGSNNLPNLMQEGDNWKVRLIEEEFMKRMWETA